MKVFQLCESTIINANHEFPLGLIIYTIILAASVVLIAIAVSEKNIPKLYTGLIGLFVSIFSIWFFGNMSPYLNVGDMVQFKILSIVFAVSIAILVFRRIFYDPAL